MSDITRFVKLMEDAEKGQVSSPKLDTKFKIKKNSRSGLYSVFGDVSKDDFGTYESMDDAKERRDQLNDSKANLRETKEPKDYSSGKYCVQHDTKENLYTVYGTNKKSVYGVFFNRDDAIKYIKTLSDKVNGTDAPKGTAKLGDYTQVVGAYSKGKTTKTGRINESVEDYDSVCKALKDIVASWEKLIDTIPVFANDEAYLQAVKVLKSAK